MWPSPVLPVKERDASSNKSRPDCSKATINTKPDGSNGWKMEEAQTPLLSPRNVRSSGVRKIELKWYAISAEAKGRSCVCNQNVWITTHFLK